MFPTHALLIAKFFFRVFQEAILCVRCSLVCAMVSPVSSDLISTCPSSNHSILCAFLAFRPVGEASRFPGASAKTTTKLSEGTGTLLFGTSRLGHRVRGSGGWDGGGCCPKNVTWVLHSGSARPGRAGPGRERLMLRLEVGLLMLLLLLRRW